MFERSKQASNIVTVLAVVSVDSIVDNAKLIQFIITNFELYLVEPAHSAKQHFGSEKKVFTSLNSYVPLSVALETSQFRYNFEKITQQAPKKKRKTGTGEIQIYPLPPLRSIIARGLMGFELRRGRERDRLDEQGNITGRLSGLGGDAVIGAAGAAAPVNLNIANVNFYFWSDDSTNVLMRLGSV